MKPGLMVLMKEKFKSIHELSKYYFIKTHWVRHISTNTLNQISFNQSVPCKRLINEEG